jgi:prepilin-type N-terminal cleavage/methylation domain-containing protein
MTSRAFQLRPRRPRQGFTLLELCIVLFIMALLAGTAMPAMQSAFTEQSLRGDAHQLSLMVKTAMITSGEQQRPYVMALEGGKWVMEPVSGTSASDGSSVTEKASGTEATPHEDIDPQPEDVTLTQALGNKLEFPDAQKRNVWETLPSVRWTFQPDGLCPLPRVRLQRGSAYIEMSFNALTGDVEDEASYLP